MGFFSQDCERCGHPALSPYSAEGINWWMVHVVVIRPDGVILRGDYDGYGRLLASDDDCVLKGEIPEDQIDDAFDKAVGFGFDGKPATVWHYACWEVDGKPEDYRGDSRGSQDQGYFFGKEHDVPDPRDSPKPTEKRYEPA